MRGSWVYGVGGLAVGAATVALVLLPAQLAGPSGGAVISVPGLAAPRAVQLASSVSPGAWVHPARHPEAKRRPTPAASAAARAGGGEATRTVAATELVSAERPSSRRSVTPTGVAASPSGPSGSVAAAAPAAVAQAPQVPTAAGEQPAVRRHRIDVLHRIISRPHPVRQVVAAAEQPVANAAPAAAGEVKALADTLQQAPATIAPSTPAAPSAPTVTAPGNDPHRPGLQPQLLGIGH